MLEEGRVEALTNLGLTILQAKVYLSFFTAEKLTANAVAKDSGIARQEVYRVINELLGLGLLRKVIARPSIFEPVPIETSIAFLLNKKRENLAKAENEAHRLMSTFANSCKAPQQEYGFRVMQENDKEYRSVNMWAGFKRLDLLLNSRRYSQMLLQSDDADKALEAGTEMRVILDHPKHDSPLYRRIAALTEFPIYSAKCLPYEPKALFIVIDRKEVYIVTKPWLPSGPPYLISNHPCLIELAQNYFDALWRRATKF